MSRKGKWISCFVMVLFGITSFDTLGQSVSASENVIVSSSDREITEPKIIEFGEQGGIQARVQVFKFSILFPPGQYPSAVYSTHMYIGHLERVSYVGGAQYIGHYSTGI